MRKKSGVPAKRVVVVHKREKIKGRLAVLLLAAAVLCYLLFCMSRSFGPAVRESMQYACKSIAADAISIGIHDALQEDPGLYDGLYQLAYDENGQVRTVTTDTARLNHVEIALGDAMGEVLQQNQESMVEIPLGSLLGWRFLTDKGPDVDFSMSQSSFVLSEVSSSMESTGINQTDFKVNITFTIDMVASLSGYVQTVEVQETICVVQMVLGGETPQVYAHA